MNKISIRRVDNVGNDFALLDIHLKTMKQIVCTFECVQCRKGVCRQKEYYCPIRFKSHTQSFKCVRYLCSIQCSAKYFYAHNSVLKKWLFLWFMNHYLSMDSPEEDPRSLEGRREPPGKTPCSRA